MSSVNNNVSSSRSVEKNVKQVEKAVVQQTQKSGGVKRRGEEADS